VKPDRCGEAVRLMPFEFPQVEKMSSIETNISLASSSATASACRTSRLLNCRRYGLGIEINGVSVGTPVITSA
jgi:hypothetical protein